MAGCFWSSHASLLECLWYLPHASRSSLLHRIAPSHSSWVSHCMQCRAHGTRKLRVAQIGERRPQRQSQSDVDFVCGLDLSIKWSLALGCHEAKEQSLSELGHSSRQTFGGIISECLLDERSRMASPRTSRVWVSFRACSYRNISQKRWTHVDLLEWHGPGSQSGAWGCKTSRGIQVNRHFMVLQGSDHWEETPRNDSCLNWNSPFQDSEYTLYDLYDNILDTDCKNDS